MQIPHYTFMTEEQSYKYYKEFMWKGRYAECISVEKTVERMKGGKAEWKRLLENIFNADWIKILMLQRRFLATILFTASAMVRYIKALDR